MKTEIPDINKRFLKILEEKKYSGYKLSKEVKEITESKLTHIRSGRNEPSTQMINALLKKFNDINYTWLLTGEGDIINNETSKPDQPNNTVTQVPTEDYMMVEFVDLRATAGYIGGEAVENLPYTHTRLVPKEYSKGNYLVIRVDGDSMDDGTKRSISDGDELLIKERDLSNNDLGILPIKTALFVLTTREGNVVKQIQKVNEKEGYIILSSFNPKFKDYKVSIEDIFQIFIVCKIVNKSITI